MGTNGEPPSGVVPPSGPADSEDLDWKSGSRPNHDGGSWGAGSRAPERGNP